jgi:serine protease Do
MKKFLLLVIFAAFVHQISAQDLADLFDQVKNTVVTVYTAENVNTGTGDPRTFTSNMGLGSGVLIRNDMVLTAAHVVGNAEEIMVQLFDGQAVPAKTVRISKIADVAVIQLLKPLKNPQVATLGVSDSTRIGEEVFVIGAPMGLPFSLSRGVISGRHSEENKTYAGKILEFFQTDAAINTGNSGGPMFNNKGEVIGIVSSILSRSGGFEGIGFAATSEIAQSVLSSKGSKYFGIDAVLLPQEMAVILNVPQKSGWLVQHVVKNSPAGVSGIQGGFRKVTINEEEIMLGGDIILSVDDILVENMDSLAKIFLHLEASGSTARHKLTVLRGGEKVDLYWVASDFY